jgi:hypothetical protein
MLERHRTFETKLARCSLKSSNGDRVVKTEMPNHQTLAVLRFPAWLRRWYVCRRGRHKRDGSMPTLIAPCRYSSVHKPGIGFSDSRREERNATARHPCGGVSRTGIFGSATEFGVPHGGPVIAQGQADGKSADEKNDNHHMRFFVYRTSDLIGDWFNGPGGSRESPCDGAIPGRVNLRGEWKNAWFLEVESIADLTALTAREGRIVLQSPQSLSRRFPDLQAMRRCGRSRSTTITTIKSDRLPCCCY